jgi:hypothetical protein
MPIYSSRGDGEFDIAAFERVIDLCFGGALEYCQYNPRFLPFAAGLPGWGFAIGQALTRAR